MSSGDESSPDSSSDSERWPPSRLSSRLSSRPQSQTPGTPGTPRKRRRLESLEPSRVRKYYLEGKYNDAYRDLFNDDVRRAATRFEPLQDTRQHYTTQYGASTWSGEEQAALFAALARLGKDDIAGIAQAVGTKTVPETHELLLLLDEAATTKGDMGLTLRDIPAAIEVGDECREELDVMAEALAWYQEQWEVTEEQQRYGDYWLITPPIAADIELAINGPSRAASSRPVTPAEPDTPRSGSGIAGSCVRCRHHKIRCDRKTPCTNCARLKKKVLCEYKPSKRQPLPTEHHASAQTPEQEEQAPEVVNAMEPQILQAIPQAGLLHPENMLILSKDLFMNRSPDLPSPWPHWSAYASEQVLEPSMMRTAFNDLHTLAVSVTKRLMQTAIIQATSRLRSQRRRTKKSVMPFVKTRDVLSAIDVLGLKRNGRAHWTGVARRCNLRVFDEQRTTRFRVKRREIPWDQAEKVLSLYDAVTAQSITDMAGLSDTEDDAFKRRAARHGTPLPMGQLSLSTSHSNAETEDDTVESDLALSDVGPATPVQSGSTGLTTDDETAEGTQLPARTKQSLERFDYEASRQEEEALCKLLGITATASKSKSPQDPDLESDVEDERLFTKTEDWRRWTEYHSTWEEYQSPVPLARFIANQKPQPPPYTLRASVDSDESSNAPQSPNPFASTGRTAVELSPQKPSTYAAMQSSTYGVQSDAGAYDMSEFDDDTGADVPAQSIEDAGHIGNIDAMEWET